MISCFDEKKFAKDLDVIIKYQYLCGAKRNNAQTFHQAEKRKSCLTWDVWVFHPKGWSSHEGFR